MARARNIKPSFFANDELADLPAMARLLFIGLWTISDREGRTEDRPRRIKAEVLPYDECNVDELLDMLNKSGFIIRYASGDSKFIQVTNFAKHQNPHVKESPSEIPAPTEHQTSTVQEKCEEQPKPEQAGLIPDSPLLIPDTPSQKGESRKRSTTTDKPESVSDATWQDFLTLRKSKKAPVTDTVMAAMQREAGKAGVSLEIAMQTCCETGWQGFNASWYANRQASQPRGAAPTETAYQRSQRLRVAEACPDLARPAPDASEFFRTAKPMGHVVEVQAREVERIAR